MSLVSAFGHVGLSYDSNSYSYLHTQKNFFGGDEIWLCLFLKNYFT